MLLGAAFFLIFAAFNSSQNLVTSLLAGNLGFVSLCVLYATVCLCLPLVPFIVSKVDARRAMCGSALLYSCYVGSLISGNFWAVNVCAVLLGFGAAVLWTVQGAFLSALSTDAERGDNVGLFWAIFSASTIIGNLTSFVFLHFFPHLDERWLMGGFTGLGIAGSLLLLFLRRPVPVEPRGVAASDDDGVPGSIQTPAALEEAPLTGVRGLLSLFRLKQTWLLMPLNVLVGAELSYNVGAFPTYLPDATYIGLVMMMTGFAAVFGGAVWGRLNVKIERRGLCLTLGILVYMTGLVASWLFHMAVIGEFPLLVPAIPYLPYVIAFFLGLGDTNFNVAYLATTGTAFDRRHGTLAFAFFQFCQSLGSTLVFFLGTYYPVAGPTGSLVLPLVVGGNAIVALVAFLFSPMTFK